MLYLYLKKEVSIKEDLIDISIYIYILFFYNAKKYWTTYRIFQHSNQVNYAVDKFPEYIYVYIYTCTTYVPVKLIISITCGTLYMKYQLIFVCLSFKLRKVCEEGDQTLPRD